MSWSICRFLERASRKTCKRLFQEIEQVLPGNEKKFLWIELIFPRAPGRAQRRMVLLAPVGPRATCGAC